MSYVGRVSRAAWPKPRGPKKTVATKRAERANATDKVDAYKLKYTTYAQLLTLKGLEMKEIFSDMNTPGRSALRFKDGTLIAKLAEALGLQSVA